MTADEPTATVMVTVPIDALTPERLDAAAETEADRIAPPGWDFVVGRKDEPRLIDDGLYRASFQIILAKRKEVSGER